MQVREDPEELSKLAVISLYTDQGTDYGLPVDRLKTVVMYWQPNGRQNPRLIMAEFKARVVGGNLVIGGNNPPVSVFNAAIGRRLCPQCLAHGTKAPVTERGDTVGSCDICGTRASYILTAFNPWFFYFSHGKSGDLHVVYNSPEHKLAEELKTALRYMPVRDLTLPTRVRQRGDWEILDPWVPALIRPVVFDRRDTPLKGRFGTTVYDFNVKL